MEVSVAPVPENLPEYDRGEWRHWTDEDSDCQNARQEVLIAESTFAVTFQTPDECRVASGRWQGPYTGEVETDPGKLDIDHLVPLENAHRSGAWAWDRERKREFANHIGYDNHLLATSSSANRSKGSKGPERWRPPLESYWCVYAIDWIAVKNDWGLTVTEAEFGALRQMLATCPMPALLQRAGEARPPAQTIAATPAPAPTETPAPPSVVITPTPRPTVPPGLKYDPFGPDRNCGDFDTYEEALEFYLAAGGACSRPAQSGFQWRREAVRFLAPIQTHRSVCNGSGFQFACAGRSSVLQPDGAPGPPNSNRDACSGLIAHTCGVYRPCSNRYSCSCADSSPLAIAYPNPCADRHSCASTDVLFRF